MPLVTTATHARLLALPVRSRMELTPASMQQYERIQQCTGVGISKVDMHRLPQARAGRAAVQLQIGM